MAPAAEDPGAKYELRHQIGRGSFGSAFLVSNKQDKADYVLKRVRLAKQTKWQRNSTLQERELATSLRHPFIVPCVESWVVQNHTVNMIYNFCQNGDLSSYLAKIRKQEGQVEEGVMQKWLCQLLLALDYLQTQRVLHRDIKTSNLMLTCDDDVQLGDFGLATLMEEHGDESKPQDTNLVGTPHYMSPELLSCKGYGFKTDVWSLGCVFYELTAQRPTFNAFNIHGLVSKIKKNKLAPLPNSYSSDWRDVVELMLCKNPDRRPSVQQLMQLPSLRPAMLEARARALELMPAVPLPPLLEPTPLTPQPMLGEYRNSCGADVAGESEGSAGSASDQQGCTRSGGGGGSEAGSSRASARRSAPGLAAAQAVQASELSELWKANFGQVAQEEQQQLDTEHRMEQQAPAEQLVHAQQQQEEQDQQYRTPPRQRRSQAAAPGSSGGGGSRDGDSTIHGSPSPAGSSGSGLTGGAGGQADSRGFGYSPRGGVLGVIDGYKRIATSKLAHVNQPGIKRTPSERVAAAIAAAGTSPPAQAPQAAAAPEAPSGRVTPDLCPRPVGLPGPQLSRTSRSSCSSKLPPSEGSSSPAGQQSTGAVTPRLPSSIAKQRPPASAGAAVVQRQDSARRQRSSIPDTSQPASSSRTQPQAVPQEAGIDQQGVVPPVLPSHTGAAHAASSSRPASASRPLSAPRSSSVTHRASDRSAGGTGAGAAGTKQQRPPWGGGPVRSCLTPGRERPQHSPILKAVKAQNSPGSSPGAEAPQQPTAAAAAGPAGASGSKTQPRRSHGQASPVPLERAMSREAGSPAAGAEGAAQRDHVQDGQQQTPQMPRRASSSVLDACATAAAAGTQAAAGEAARTGTPSRAAHGLPRSASYTCPAAEKQPQQQQEAGGTSPQGLRGLSPSTSQHRRSAPGASLPPLPLHKLQRSSSKGSSSTQSPLLSPLPMASPVYGQDRCAPERSSSLGTQGSADQQLQPCSPGSPFSRYAAVAPTPARTAPSTAAKDPQQPGVTDRSAAMGAQGGRVLQDERTKQARAALAAAGGSIHSNGNSDSKRRGSPSTADADAAAAAGNDAGRTVSSAVGSRRVSAGNSSTSRRSSSSDSHAGSAARGSLTDRRSSPADPQQQQPGQDSAHNSNADRNAGAGTARGRTSSSGGLTSRQDLQQHQQQQEEQQQRQQRAPDQQLQQPEQLLQRLDLLESAMMVIGGLVERKRWTELSAVMQSEGLLPDLQAAALQAAAAGQHQQQPSAADVLKLGDIVVLGRSRGIKGNIRYLGPVAWDASGSEWVGMELDRPCGVDATQRGITYFDCQPRCASFHRATDLTTLGA